MQYSQHEFVKMNEVGLLITEAMQGMLDKLQSKEIAIRDNKHQIRQIDTKVRQIDQQVVGLLKLNHQMKDMYRLTKGLSSDSEQQKRQLEELKEHLELKFGEVEARMDEMQRAKDQQDVQVRRLLTTVGEFDTKMEDQSNKIKLNLMDVRSELIVQFKQQEF